MLTRLQIFIKKLLISLTLLLLAMLQTSCYKSKIEESNKAFLENYKKEVEAINLKRNQGIEHIDEEDLLRRSSAKKYPPIGKIILSTNRSKGMRELTPTEIYQAKMNKVYFEQGSKLESTISSLRSRPDLEIQQVSYNMDNFPQEYDRGIISFDDIKIPSYDYFGINSNLEDKKYDIIDPIILQKNINHLDQYFDPETKQINLTLLKEKEEIRKNKMEELFLDFDVKENDKKMQDSKNY